MELRRKEENLEKYHGREIKRNGRFASHPPLLPSSGLPEKKTDDRDERETGSARRRWKDRDGKKERDVFNL